MKRLDDVAVAKAEAAKVARTLIRLRHSLGADREIRATVPDILDDIDAAASNGNSFTLDLPGLLGLGDGS